MTDYLPYNPKLRDLKNKTKQNKCLLYHSFCGSETQGEISSHSKPLTGLHSRCLLGPQMAQIAGPEEETLPSSSRWLQAGLGSLEGGSGRSPPQVLVTWAHCRAG